MPSFNDNSGRTWTVDIDVNQMKRCRERLGFELGRLLADEFKLLNDLATDPILLVDVLYVLCEPQLKAAGLSDIEFGRAMVSDAVVDGFVAVQDAYLNFCPRRQVVTLIDLLAVFRERNGSTTVNGTAGNSAESAESPPMTAG